MRAVCAEGRRQGLLLHLDGARLWHAVAVSGIPEREYAEPFDTVNVCFSKGLGAPVGSALAGGHAAIARARRFRQQLGGGLRQAGVLAAAALYAIEHHRSDLGRDVENARTLAAGLAALDGVDLDPTTVQSNIVRFELTAGDAAAFVERCHAAGLHLLPGGSRSVRAVLHRDVDGRDVERALEIFAGVLAVVPVGR
jgi:threonine aldolase